MILNSWSPGLNLIDLALAKHLLVVLEEAVV